MSVNANVQISTSDSEFAIKPDNVSLVLLPYVEVIALPMFYIYSCETPPSVQAPAANCEFVMSIDNVLVVTPSSAWLLKCQFEPTKVSSSKSMVSVLSGSSPVLLFGTYRNACWQIAVPLSCDDIEHLLMSLTL